MACLLASIRIKECEKALSRNLSRNYPQAWIAVDGTLFDIDGTSDDMKDAQIVGISKSFQLNPEIERNSERQPIGHLVGTLTELPTGWRSPVYSSPVYKLLPDRTNLRKYTIIRHNVRFGAGWAFLLVSFAAEHNCKRSVPCFQKNWQISVECLFQCDRF